MNNDRKEFVQNTIQTYLNLLNFKNHEGNLNKGHYFTYAKNDEDKNWYEFDDENVRLIKKPQKKVINSNNFKYLPN